MYLVRVRVRVRVRVKGEGEGEGQGQGCATEGEDVEKMYLLPFFSPTFSSHQPRDPAVSSSRSTYRANMRRHSSVACLGLGLG